MALRSVMWCVLVCVYLLESWLWVPPPPLWWSCEHCTTCRTENKVPPHQLAWGNKTNKKHLKKVNPSFSRSKTEPTCVPMCSSWHLLVTLLAWQWWRWPAWSWQQWSCYRTEAEQCCWVEGLGWPETYASQNCQCRSRRPWQGLLLIQPLHPEVETEEGRRWAMRNRDDFITIPPSSVITMYLCSQ